MTLGRYFEKKTVLPDPNTQDLSSTIHPKVYVIVSMNRE